MMNCWKEAVATGLQLQYFTFLLLHSDSDGGAESGRVSCLSIDVLFLSAFGRQFVGHDGSGCSEADTGFPVLVPGEEVR